MIDDIAQRLRVSIIPVREALRLLQSEGLVVSVAHVGATVAPLSRTSIADVFTTMEGLELVATREAAQKAGPSDVEVLAELVAEMDRALDAGSPQRWADLNTRFHLSIGRLADLPMLQEMIQRVFDYWDRVRRYYFRDVLIHRTRIAQAEHHLILDQIARRDLVAHRADGAPAQSGRARRVRVVPRDRAIAASRGRRARDRVAHSCAWPRSRRPTRSGPISRTAASIWASTTS